MCIFPGLPWLLEGLAMLGLYFHVASTSWRQGPSCEPRPPPPLLLHESPDPRPVGICICCHMQAPTTPGPPCQGSG